MAFSVPIGSAVGGPPFVDFGQHNNTLYVQNLNERIAIKHLIPQLKEIFSEYGQVLDVIAKRRIAMRGQAFILFDNVESAKRALEGMQGVRVYGKSMMIRFAKYKSDWLSKSDGTFEIEKRRREQDRLEKLRMPRMTRRQVLAQMTANPTFQTPMMTNMGFNTTMASTMGADMQLPNKVLYLQGLPEGVKEASLQETFKKFIGFVEVRLVPNRPDVAFIEYESEGQAAVARQATDGIELVPGMKTKVSFARR